MKHSRNRAFVFLMIWVIALISSGKLWSSVHLVTNTNDSGAGSLRQAILNANALREPPGYAFIHFNIDGSGPFTIQPLSALPMITNTVFLDGWSQGGEGHTGPPLIEINGALAGAHIVGLHLTSSGSTVRGLAVTSFATGSFAGGIRLQTRGHNWIYGNHVGVNPAVGEIVPHGRERSARAGAQSAGAGPDEQRGPVHRLAAQPREDGFLLRGEGGAVAGGGAAHQRGDQLRVAALHRGRALRVYHVICCDHRRLPFCGIY